MPSQLLERRPDIAAAERLMAQANAQIGVARAAYYPDGYAQRRGRTRRYVDHHLVHLAQPPVVRRAGPSGNALRWRTAQGHRPAIPCRIRSTIANYRETVLTAFQQIEDNLAALRLLSTEIQQQDTAVKAAQRNLAVATDRYRLGIDPYLNVITAQTALLATSRRPQPSHAADDRDRPIGRSARRRLEQFPTPFRK